MSLNSFISLHLPGALLMCGKVGKQAGDSELCNKTWLYISLCDSKSHTATFAVTTNSSIRLAVKRLEQNSQQSRKTTIFQSANHKHNVIVLKYQSITNFSATLPFSFLEGRLEKKNIDKRAGRRSFSLSASLQNGL